MALFQWITTGERAALEANLADSFDEVGLEVDKEVSGVGGIYASEKGGPSFGGKAKVTVIFSPTNVTKDEFLIEVRSSEPMLKRGTRCEQIANTLKSILVPKS